MRKIGQDTPKDVTHCPTMHFGNSLTDREIEKPGEPISLPIEPEIMPNTDTADTPSNISLKNSLEKENILLRAANMKSSDFSSISEYRQAKVRSLHRYYPDLPWDRVLSRHHIECCTGRMKRRMIAENHPLRDIRWKIKANSSESVLAVGKTGPKKNQCYSTTPNIDKAQSSRQLLHPHSRNSLDLEGDLQALGRCLLYVVLQEITLEIDFLVVPDGRIPATNWLGNHFTAWNNFVIREHGLDLQHSKTKPQIRIVTTQNDM
ncbi:hypothetical protein QE152_g33834 [Popillia japonica]|uniref:Uncharacterized protein n=1 Tax=Popillia japonica TaxID=7064 RepID=A0AAW1IVV5_POPJA